MTVNTLLQIRRVALFFDKIRQCSTSFKEKARVLQNLPTQCVINSTQECFADSETDSCEDFWSPATFCNTGASADCFSSPFLGKDQVWAVQASPCSSKIPWLALSYISYPTCALYPTRCISWRWELSDASISFPGFSIVRSDRNNLGGWHHYVHFNKLRL